MVKERMIALNVRIPPSLKALITRYIELDTHKDASEFTRDALREKIRQDAPEIYAAQFKGEQK